MVKKNILLTGRPRVGKSTLIHRVVEKLRAEGCNQIGGFYTLEELRNHERVGFSISTLEGKSGRLAEVGLESRHRLGRYGIDLESFEAIALSALEKAIRPGGIIIIDEIGFMELKSPRFRELVIRALDSNALVLATIMKSKSDFGDAIKARPDVELLTVTAENRDRLAAEILRKCEITMGHLARKTDAP